jgi:hypothetical protein
MGAPRGIGADVIDDDRVPAFADVSQIVFLISSSSPGSRPNSILSTTCAAIHLSSVTRATAAKPMQVTRQTSWRIASISASSPCAATSAANWSFMGGG